MRKIDWCTAPLAGVAFVFALGAADGPGAAGQPATPQLQKTSPAKYRTLYDAVAAGDEEDVRKHLAVEGTRKGIDSGAGTAGTVLMLAAKVGNCNILRQLLAAGANANAENMVGETALFLAVDQKRADAVRVLLEGGGKPDSRIKLRQVGMFEFSDGDLSTPLMHASGAGSLDIVNLLIAAGADPRAKNRKGQTAADLARTDEVKRVILEAASRLPNAPSSAAGAKGQPQKKAAAESNRPGGSGTAAQVTPLLRAGTYTIGESFSFVKRDSSGNVLQELYHGNRKEFGIMSQSFVFGDIPDVAVFVLLDLPPSAAARKWILDQDETVLWRAAYDPDGWTAEGTRSDGSALPVLKLKEGQRLTEAQRKAGYAIAVKPTGLVPVLKASEVEPRAFQQGEFAPRGATYWMTNGFVADEEWIAAIKKKSSASPSK